MSLAVALNHITSNAAGISPAMLGTLDQALLKAAQIRGAFPTSLNLHNAIKAALTKEGATVEEIARMICADHVLALRLISIANYAHYKKGQALLTVSGAVKHLGLSKVGEVITDLAEAKNFNAIYLGRAVSMTMMQQAVIASDLSTRFVHLIEPKLNLEEETYVTSALTNLGPLLLAFFKPNVYSALCLDSLDDRGLFAEAFRRVLRKSLGEFAGSTVRALGLPEEYGEIVALTDSAPWERKSWGGVHSAERRAIATAVYMANLIAHEICYFTGVQGVQGLMRELHAQTGIALTALEDTVGVIADLYMGHTEMLALKPVRMPEYLLWFAPTDIETHPGEWQGKLPGINERINPFLYELRSCFKARAKPGEFCYLPLAVHGTLSGLIKGLNFDRAVFFKVAGSEPFLQLAVCLGVKLFQPEKLRRSLKPTADDARPDVQAYHSRQPVFSGEPVFPDGWPFVSFPAIWRDQVVGVFYADKIRRPDSDALDTPEQIGCTALAEEWHKIEGEFY